MMDSQGRAPHHLPVTLCRCPRRLSLGWAACPPQAGCKKSERSGKEKAELAFSGLALLLPPAAAPSLPCTLLPLPSRSSAWPGGATSGVGGAVSLPAAGPLALLKESPAGEIRGEDTYDCQFGPGSLLDPCQ